MLLVYGVHGFWFLRAYRAWGCRGGGFRPGLV